MPRRTEKQSMADGLGINWGRPGALEKIGFFTPRTIGGTRKVRAQTMLPSWVLSLWILLEICRVRTHRKAPRLFQVKIEYYGAHPADEAESFFVLGVSRLVPVAQGRGK